MDSLIEVDMKGSLRYAVATAGLVIGLACGDETTGPTPPATPTGLAIQQLTLSSARVTWNAVTDADTYVLERAASTNPGTFVQLADTITGAQYDDGALAQSVTYSYRVAAHSTGGTSAFSTPVNFSTTVVPGLLTGNIAASRTLYKDTVYTLSGYVKVQNGATLTIQAGTKIIGDTTLVGSSLWILRGAKIVAAGTLAEPIVFTSARAAGHRKPGDWGGLIIIGNGIINRTGSPIYTEGGAAGQAEDYSGGNDNADSSGVLRYVRVEFAGYDVSGGAGQELNTISSYAVGSRTHFEYVQSMSGLDDSFEFWGGAVSGKYLVSYEAGDDHYDWTEGWQGKLQYVIAFQSQQLQPAPGTGVVSTDPRGFEADGCDPAVSGCVLSVTSASTPYSNPTIANFTLVGTGNLTGYPNDGNGMVLRRGTGGYLFNGIITRYKGTACQMRDNFTDTLRVRDTLRISNVILADNAANYDNVGADTVGSAARFCQQAKWASDNHRTSAAAAATLFISLNPASLDFSPATNSLADTMTVTIPLPAARRGTYLDNTTFVGAADGTTLWWQGWTTYIIN
jgi:hypothetical protein